MVLSGPLSSLRLLVFDSFIKSVKNAFCGDEMYCDFYVMFNQNQLIRCFLGQFFLLHVQDFSSFVQGLLLQCCPVCIIHRFSYVKELYIRLLDCFTRLLKQITMYDFRNATKKHLVKIIYMFAYLLNFKNLCL